MLRRGQIRLRLADLGERPAPFRLRRTKLIDRVGIDDRNRHSRRMRLRARGIEVGFGVLQLRLIVSRVEFDQQRSGLDELIVLHFRIDIGHRAADSGTDRIQVPLHLRVVGGFVTPRSVPQGSSCRHDCGED